MTGSRQCSSSSPTNHWLWSEQSRSSIIKFIGIIFLALSLVNRWNIVPKYQEGLRLSKNTLHVCLYPRPTGSTQGTMVLPDTDHYCKSTEEVTQAGSRATEHEPRWERTAGCWHTLPLPNNQTEMGKMRKRSLRRASFPDVFTVPSGSFIVTRKRAWSKGKKGCAHTGLCMHMFNTFTELTKYVKQIICSKKAFYTVDETLKS